MFDGVVKVSNWMVRDRDGREAIFSLAPALDGVLHRFAGFAGAFLYPSQQFILFSVKKLEIVIR
jgi:hypothetical protein